jgi:hypothetical protein
VIRDFEVCNIFFKKEYIIFFYELRGVFSSKALFGFFWGREGKMSIFITNKFPSLVQKAGIFLADALDLNLDKLVGREVF